MTAFYALRVRRMRTTLMLLSLTCLHSCGCSAPVTPGSNTKTTDLRGELADRVVTPNLPTLSQSAKPTAMSGRSDGCGSFRVGGTVATCALWNPADQPLRDLSISRILFVVWADVPDAYCSGGADAKHATYSAFFQPRGGGRVSWEAETTNGSDVSLTLNHAKYDLAAGRLFLLTTKAGQPQVRQLKRDLSQLRPETANFEKLAREDADLAQFIAAAEKAR
jgi:hypothetical protein